MRSWANEKETNGLGVSCKDHPMFRIRRSPQFANDKKRVRAARVIHEMLNLHFPNIFFFSCRLRFWCWKMAAKIRSLCTPANLYIMVIVVGINKSHRKVSLSLSFCLCVWVARPLWSMRSVDKHRRCETDDRKQRTIVIITPSHQEERSARSPLCHWHHFMAFYLACALYHHHRFSRLFFLSLFIIVSLILSRHIIMCLL